MALYEDRDTQAQHYWQARLTRERLNISASVEETLADTSLQEQWSDDEQHYVAVDHSISSTALVPPRLSLQSKALPSVRPASFVQSVTAEIVAQAVSKEKEGSQKSQNTNILTRLAQRFTSSLTAFGAAMQPEVPALMPPSDRFDAFVVEERHLVTTPPAYAMPPLEVSQTPLATVIEAIPAPSSMTSPHPVQSKQRLAGHTSKIRLQNTSVPKVTPRPTESEIHNRRRENRQPLREPLIVNVRLREKTPEVPCSDVPVVTTLHEETHALHTSHAEESSTVATNVHCASFFGVGTFESGQGEVMIRNTHTTASSVVQVILTSNPGPTLVQYVSLHPEVGFTLHLTAPAASKTTFNYILLVNTAV
ncbi:MAG: hypothetical protein NVS4B11_19940 [Ktedonobacteraceae bacterium]